MYVRNLTEGFGLSWQTVYQTNAKNVVEEYCNKNGISFSWENDKHLRITWTRPAIQNHPLTGEPVWFNHGFFFNAFNLIASVREVLFSSEEYPFNTYYGDGTPIEIEVINEIGNAYEASKKYFTWQKGDILLLDNMLMSHGRNSYKGQRSIIVGMADPYSLIAAKADTTVI
jgi:alpha-ketoglutarate-dependent taurine dioxygenase